MRQSNSVPVLEKIKAWLDKEKDLVLPRSPMAAAIGYTLNQWEALCRYCEQGYLAIDNNAAERAMKRVAIGRKNWLFAGNDEFGQYHAVEPDRQRRAARNRSAAVSDKRAGQDRANVDQ
jgi:transposase